MLNETNLATTEPHNCLLNNNDAAAIIGVTPQMLNLSRHSGFLFKGVKPPVHLKLGRSIRYSSRDLIEWIESQQRFVSTAESHINPTDP